MNVKVAGVALGIGASVFAAACCGVVERGAVVRFLGQTNIVVWDSKRGVEHFIRDASFDTKAKGLGFIAPSPSEPELSEVNAKAFSLLASLQPSPPAAKEDAPAAATASADASVTVIHEQDVAGYHATVLKATDAAGLRAWLGKNGYETPAFLEGWVKPYVDKGWYLTAFKVKADDTASTGPIRMSFKTDRAFNPYSVPKENGGGGASLRLYYVSAGQEVPMVGGTDDWQKQKWTAPLDSSNSVELAGYLKLPADAMPENASVTTYVDPNFGQPGRDDLYFVTPDNRASLAFMGGAVALFAYGLARRRGQRAQTAS